DVELPGGAGPAGAVECGAAVPVSRGDDSSVDPDTADAECCGCYECTGCSAGSEERGATVSVPGRGAGGFVFFVFELGGCEAGAARWIERCGEFRVEQFELGLGLFELQGRRC